MADITAHMSDCRAIIGYCVFKQVHEFLDQYAKVFDVDRYGEYHRTFLHNKYGIEVVRAKWGLDAGIAAKIHIVRDYIEIPVQRWTVVKKNLGKALMYFNTMDYFEPRMIVRFTKPYQN